MKRFSILMLASTAAVLAGCSGAGTSSAGPAAPPPEGYLLRLNQKVGDTASYSVKMDMELLGKKPPPGQPSAIAITMDYTTKVTKAEGGKFTYEFAYTDMKMNGQTAPNLDQMKKQKMTMVMNDRGKTLSMEGVPGMSNGSPGGDIQLPEKKVKVGDTWEGEADVQGQKVKGKYKLEGVEKVADINAVVITCTFDSKPISSPTPMKTWVNPVTGEVLKAEGLLMMDMMGQKVKTTFKLQKK